MLRHMVVGKRTSELESDGLPPTSSDLVAFTDVVQGRSEQVPVGTFAESPAFLLQGVVLTWSGSDYVPAQFKALSTPKEFRGPTDPAGVGGVVLNTYDTWVDTS